MLPLVLSVSIAYAVSIMYAEWSRKSTFLTYYEEISGLAPCPPPKKKQNKQNKQKQNKNKTKQNK